VARFAEANRIPNWTLDGNDVVALARAFQEAFALARAGEGPAFIEAVTYRWLGHVGHREDLDVGVRRSADLVIWKKRDPIGRLARALIGAHVLSEADYEEMTATIGTLVSQALRAAQEAPFPQAEALLNLVYSEQPL
jgi:TPP-dependent pyruvate/acetoin dehydrogenase alpha subunit